MLELKSAFDIFDTKYTMQSLEINNIQQSIVEMAEAIAGFRHLLLPMVATQKIMVEKGHISSDEIEKEINNILNKREEINKGNNIQS